jgi:hypothetical protein
MKPSFASMIKYSGGRSEAPSNKYWSAAIWLFVGGGALEAAPKGDALGLAWVIGGEELAPTITGFCIGAIYTYY